MNDLIDGALNGDINSLENLVNKILPILYKHATQRLECEDDINDAIQETLIKFYNNLYQLNDKEHFVSWVIKILDNECNKICNKKIIQKNMVNKIKSFGDTELFESTIDKVDSTLDFNILIELLTREEQLLFNLYYGKKYQLKEIAAIRNENINTIKSKILRAKRKIADKMGGGNKHV